MAKRQRRVSDRRFGRAVEFSAPDETTRVAINEGRLLAADATAAVELLQPLGFAPIVIELPRPTHVEIVAVADRKYGADDPDLGQVLDTILAHQSEAGIICRKATADELRKQYPILAQPLRGNHLLHFGAMRGVNVMEQSVTTLLVTRYYRNVEALRHTARIFRMLLNRPPEDATDDCDTLEVPFPGTPWARDAMKVPRDPVLRAVVDAARRETVQAIGRLRPHNRPRTKLTVYLLDGDPVPGVVYDRVLTERDDLGTPGGLPELLEELYARHPAKTESIDDPEGGEIDYGDDLLELAEELRLNKEEAQLRQRRPLDDANLHRKSEAEFRRRALGFDLARVHEEDPHASLAALAKKTGHSIWEVRQAKASLTTPPGFEEGPQSPHAC